MNGSCILYVIYIGRDRRAPIFWGLLFFIGSRRATTGSDVILKDRAIVIMYRYSGNIQRVYPWAPVDQV